MNSAFYYLGRNLPMSKKSSTPLSQKSQNTVLNSFSTKSNQATNGLSRAIYLRGPENKNRTIEKNMSNLADEAAQSTMRSSINQENQVVTINNQVFVKSKSPSKNSFSPSIKHCLSSDSNAKVIQLENKLKEISAQKHGELMEAYTQNKRLMNLLEIQRKRSALDVMQTPIKLLSNKSQLELAQHEFRVSSLKNRLQQMEQTLRQVQSLNCELQKDNQWLRESVKNNIQKKSVLQSQEPEIENQYMEQQKNEKIEIEQQLQQYIVSLEQQILRMEEEGKLLRIDTQKKINTIEQKDRLILQLKQTIAIKEQQLFKSEAQNKQLSELLKQRNRLLGRNTGYGKEEQIVIPIRYGESQSINIDQIKQQKLKDVSLGMSILINEQNPTPTNQKLESRNSESPMSLKTSSEYLDTKRSNLDQQIKGQDDLCDIIKKMQLLMQTNQRIENENKILIKKLSTLEQQKNSLQDTLQLAFENTYWIQNNVSVANQNQNKKIQKQNRMSLNLSQSQVRSFKQIECQKCAEMARVIANITSQFNINVNESYSSTI